MGKTLGTMFTMTTYGSWLRGDERGWIEDGKLMPPNPHRGRESLAESRWLSK